MSCDPPAGFRSRSPLQKPPCKLRRLHWAKLPHTRCAGSAWKQVDEMPELDVEKYTPLLHSSFGIVPKRSEPRRSQAKKTGDISFCSGQRAQLILLAMFQLRSFDARPEDLVRALTSMDVHALTRGSSPDEVEETLGTRVHNAISPSSR